GRTQCLRIKCAFLDRRIEFLEQLFFLARHDVLSMQRDGEERAAFVPGVVAPQIQIVRYGFEIVFGLVLSDNEKRKTSFERGGRQLTVQDLLERAGKFFPKSLGCFETGIDRVVDRPERLTGDKRIRGVAARPIRKRSVGEERGGELFHATPQRWS